MMTARSHERNQIIVNTVRSRQAVPRHDRLPASSPMAALLTPELLRRLEQFQLLAARRAKSSAKGERRSRARGQSVEFADHRSYVPGDDFRYLDWNLFGRLDRLFLKLYEEERELPVRIFLDASESMTFGEPAKFDFARQVAAARERRGIEETARRMRYQFLAFAAEKEACDAVVTGHGTIDGRTVFVEDALPGMTLFDLGGLQFEMEQLLACEVDIVTSGGLPSHVKDRILNLSFPLLMDSIGTRYME